MRNPLDLSGKSFLVTGASSGIGRDAAQLLAELGARVALSGRDEKRLADSLGALAGEGHGTFPMELGDTDRIPDWLQQVAAKTGPLAGIVHCAGVHSMMPVRFQAPAQAADVMKANWLTAWALAKGFRHKAVRAPEDARLVLMASVMAVVGQPAVTAYASSKGAVLALAKSLAMELAPEGIRVNCIVAGQVRTEMADQMDKQMPPEKLEAMRRMHPLGIGTPRDVSHAVAYLLAETGRWVTGSALVVDGGYTAH